jgi:hypothetical protein
MRVAFCISGQMRDEHMSLPAISALAREFEAQVFISTWSTRGAKASGVINVHQAARMFGFRFVSVLPLDLIGGDRLIRAFPDLEALLDDRSSLDPQALLEWFPGAKIDIEDDTVLDLSFRQSGVHDANSLRMLYKLWRCNQMKLRGERDSGALYDVVVRFRPDVVPALSPDLMQAVAQDEGGRLFLIPEGRPRPDYLNDVAAASSSANADYYAALFGAALASPERSWRLIHYELSKHLDRKEAQVDDLPLAQHITSAMDVRQPRNRELFLAEFERQGQARLGLTDADKRLLSAALGAMHELELRTAGTELREAFEAVDGEPSRPDVLYCLLTALAWLSADRRDVRGVQLWIGACVLVTSAQPLAEHEVQERIDGWVRLADEAGAGPPADWSNLDETAQALPPGDLARGLVAALRRTTSDLERYRELQARVASRTSRGPGS